MFTILVSLFSIFLYTALGTYVLTKNPHDRTNVLFSLLMVAFIIWSVGTYNIGLVTGTAGPEEIIMDMKIQYSGVVLSLTLFVFFAFSLSNTNKKVKNIFIYFLIIPSVYILYFIWISGLPGSENVLFSVPGTRQEFFLFSAVFSVGGIYLLLRHFTASKYWEHEQAKMMLIGALVAVGTAVITDIILPLFFDIYILEFSTLAPAVMGIFFAFAIYRYGLFITPVPELSGTSFCGADCTLCSKYIDKYCAGCKFDRGKYRNCEIFDCAVEKMSSGCADCYEVTGCQKRKSNIDRCFISEPGYELKPGGTTFVDTDGYNIFLDAVRHGSLGIVISTRPLPEIRKDKNLATTPVIRISDDAIDKDVRPGDIKRLGTILTNFLNRNHSSVVFMDCLDRLIAVNGFENVLKFIRMLNKKVRTTDNHLIISGDLQKDDVCRLRDGICQA